MHKSRVIIFGATNTGRRIYWDMKQQVNVIAFFDQDSNHWGKYIDGIPICSPEAIDTLEYDYIYIGVLTFYTEVMQLLKDIDVPREKIIDKYVSLPTYARIEFLKSVKCIFDDIGIEGAVAELGVYKGEFAKEINRTFPKSKLYLFDTFEGFAQCDSVLEEESGFSNKNQTGYFSDTSIELVLNKMSFRENCIIKKGYFPDTATGIEEKFVFVNIDVDLYNPILAGLEWFYPRMLKGGIILVHDYFSSAFTGAKEAVKEFSRKTGTNYLPIGDTLSIAIRK